MPMNLEPFSRYCWPSTWVSIVRYVVGFSSFGYFRTKINNFWEDEWTSTGIANGWVFSTFTFM